MFNLIEKYMNKMTVNDVNNFAISKGVNLNNEELQFTYDFIKKNYKTILGNPSLLNLDLYKNKFSPENFEKVKKILNEYYTKYQRFL
ncbi:MAG: hypothetical protein IJO33_02655 [Bacilli bacterium]|nr:hypothetical protein [Bacilli bacterium]